MDVPVVPAEMTIAYDGLSGVGVSVATWLAGERLYVGLTFMSALTEHTHDLTPEQAEQLRDALARQLAA